LRRGAAAGVSELGSSDARMQARRRSGAHGRQSAAPPHGMFDMVADVISCGSSLRAWLQ